MNAQTYDIRDPRNPECRARLAARTANMCARGAAIMADRYGWTAEQTARAAAAMAAARRRPR